MGGGLNTSKFLKEENGSNNEEEDIPELEEVEAPGRFGIGLRDRGAVPLPRGQKHVERAAWQLVPMLLRCSFCCSDAELTTDIT